MLLVLFLPLAMNLNPVFGQEVVDTSAVEVVDEITTPPDDGFVPPTVPWGIDPHAYYLNWGVFLSTILAITQLFKKLFSFEGRAAFILTVIVSLVLTAIGYFLKLGALANVDWWVPVIWFVGAIIGGKLTYDTVYKIMVILGLAKGEENQLT